MIERYSAFDEIEMSGVWWHPDDGENLITGTLNRAFNDTILVVFGAQDPIHRLIDKVACESESTLFGRTTTMKDVTLLNVISHGQPMNSGGVIESSFGVNAMLVGHLTPNVETAEFSCARFYYPGIEAWLRLPPAMQSKETIGEPGIEVAFSKPDQHEVWLDSHSASLRFSTTIHKTNQHDPPRISFQQRVMVEIAPTTPKVLNWFLRFEWHFLSLMRFLCAAPLRCDYLLLKPVPTDSDINEQFCSYYGNSKLHESPKIPARNQILLSFESIESHWPTVLQTFFRDVEQIHNSVHLLSNDIAGPSIDIEDRFLALVQCLEGFTRATGEQKYISDGEYDLVRKVLTDAIPDGIDKGLRDKITSMVTFGNEKSLRKRLNGLMSTVEPSTQKLFCHNPSAFVSGIVETRNFWTHVLADKHRSVLGGEDLYYACEKLQVLLVVLFAVHIGIPEKVVREQLKGSWMMKQKRDRYLEGRED